MNYPNLTGLAPAEVSSREKAGQTNAKTAPPTKSVGEILRTNALTFFNALNLALAAAVFFTGEYENMLFLGVIIANTSIGITQELRAKRVIDRLSLLCRAKVRVLRGGQVSEIDVDKIVLDDVLILDEGRQIPADCEVLSGEIEVNESLITGESEPVGKKQGDTLLSGSFVICGEAAVTVRKVGADSFASVIMKGAKYYKKPVSKMLASINKIIKFIAVVIVPVGVVLFIKSLFFTGESFNDAVNSSVAALIGMIPQGLILLTSVVMAVSAVRLSRHKALAQNLYCAETLARVDVLCLDKTGTLTTGEMNVEQVLPLGGADLREAEEALRALMYALPDKNPTAAAVRAHVHGRTGSSAPTWVPEKVTPFSSARKYSSVTFTGRGTFTLGAADDAVDGKRTLTLTNNRKPLAHIIISDSIRPESRETLRYFYKQNVDIKIISGDNPETVRAAALSAGVRNTGSFIDMSLFDEETDMEKIAVNHTIFGRVTPQMKLLLIKALKKSHTVGMVGDGVNDVLPLKEADCSVAMQSGSEAARNVASLVLLDNNFASLPKAVAEGRRSINNLERGAALFLTKTVYSLVLALMFLFVAAPYPFIPIQMTLINALFIGIPSLFLALEKNKDLVKGSFISNVLMKAVPYGFCAVLGIGLLAFFGWYFSFTSEELRTAATIILGVASFAVLCGICRPINEKRLVLIAASAVLFSLAVQVFEELLSIADFTPQMHMVTFSLCALMLPSCLILPKLAEKLVSRRNKK
ncbi:MAG: cation-translocating P-type ATPase [Oscillospiraceae bacterium]|nr:cation-translocating P-type ATPase [Oscillospiraceae bacterium]